MLAFLSLNSDITFSFTFFCKYFMMSLIYLRLPHLSLYWLCLYNQYKYLLQNLTGTIRSLRQKSVFNQCMPRFQQMFSANSIFSKYLCNALRPPTSQFYRIKKRIFTSLPTGWCYSISSNEMKDWAKVLLKSQI